MVGVGLLRVGAGLCLVQVREAIAIGVVLRIRQAITVGVGIERILAGLLLVGVREAVAVCVLGAVSGDPAPTRAAR